MTRARSDRAWCAALGAALAVAPCAAVFGAPFQHAFDPAGPQAAAIGAMWHLLLVVCSVVFVVLLAVFLVALLRAPRADAHTAPDLAPLTTADPHARRVIVWAVAVSTFLLLVLVAASVATDRALARLPADGALQIQVTARQWWWHVRYGDAEPSRMFVTANELHIPVGRPVVLTLESADVIHSFWVPNLAGKKDLVPGRTATLRLQADRPGTYRGQCAEFCGTQHARMAFVIVAEAPADYERWAERQRQPAREPADDLQRRGRDVFQQASCPMCHAIQGTLAGGRNGPDLTHLASRGTLAAGTLPNNTGNLAGWIVDPQSVKPGVNMPANVLPPDDLQALLAYLGSLQ